LEELNHILSKFECVDLQNITSFKLMDRVDTKFTFSRSQLPSILANITEQYKVLTVNEKTINRYKTLYYDTSNYSLYTKHHCGKLNRHKIRYRTYMENNLSFLEVKFKNNKGRTLKTRLAKNLNANELDEESKVFLEKNTPLNPELLIPTLFVNYSRITFISKTSRERVTIDIDLEFVKENHSEKYGKLVIAEIKQEGKETSSFIKLMKQLHVSEGSISKYCMGIAVSDKNAKQNNFKEKLLTIQKIIKNDLTTSSK
jgi:hypothetical protein